jgi:hypothetical protein
MQEMVGSSSRVYSTIARATNGHVTLPLDNQTNSLHAISWLGKKTIQIHAHDYEPTGISCINQDKK